MVSLNLKWATTVRATSIRSSSMPCCGRSAKRTEHMPSPGSSLVALRRPSAWARLRRPRADGHQLKRNFGLRVFSTGAKLFVQGTNQRSLEFASVERDVFVAESVGAEIDFERDAGDKVVSLTLKQRGQ